MNGKTVVSGLCGLLLLTSSASADSLLTSTEKTYRLLQTISSQLKEAQESLGPSSPAPAAAALVAAQEQVHTAFVHCCHALYANQLQAAKAALVRRNQQKALQHLLKADEVLSKCAEHAPVAEPHNDQEGPVFENALAQR